MKLVAIGGLPGTGKTTLIRYIEEQFEGPRRRFLFSSCTLSVYHDSRAVVLHRGSAVDAVSLISTMQADPQWDDYTLYCEGPEYFSQAMMGVAELRFWPATWIVLLAATDIRTNRIGDISAEQVQMNELVSRSQSNLYARAKHTHPVLNESPRDLETAWEFIQAALQADELTQAAT